MHAGEGTCPTLYEFTSGMSPIDPSPESQLLPGSSLSLRCWLPLFPVWSISSTCYLGSGALQSSQYGIDPDAGCPTCLFFRCLESLAQQVFGRMSKPTFAMVPKWSSEDTTR